MSRELERPKARSTIAELLEAHPSAAQVLLRHGMACVGCAMAPFETLAEAAREYGVELGPFLGELGAASFGATAARKGHHAAGKLKSRHLRTEP